MKLPAQIQLTGKATNALDDDLQALLESNDGPAFDVKNVKVLYTSGQPELFWRYYSPAQ